MQSLIVSTRAVCALLLGVMPFLSPPKCAAGPYIIPSLTVNNSDVTETKWEDAEAGLKYDNFYIAGAADGKIANSFTSNLLGYNSISYTINAPEGQSFNITPSGTGQTTIQSNLSFQSLGSSDNSRWWGAMSVSFGGDSSLTLSFTQYVMFTSMYDSSGAPHRIDFQFMTDPISVPVSFSTITMSFAYAPGWDPGATLTYSPSGGSVLVGWQGDINGSDPGQYFNIGSVPEPTTAVLVLLVGAGWMVWKRRNVAII